VAKLNKTFYKTWFMGSLALIFVGFAIFCCCLTKNVMASQLVQPECHQTNQEKQSSSHADCDCSSMILAVLKDAPADTYNPTISSLFIFEPLHSSLSEVHPPLTLAYLSLPVGPPETSLYLKYSNLRL